MVNPCRATTSPGCIYPERYATNRVLLVDPKLELHNAICCSLGRDRLTFINIFLRGCHHGCAAGWLLTSGDAYTIHQEYSVAPSTTWRYAPRRR